MQLAKEFSNIMNPLGDLLLQEVRPTGWPVGPTAKYYGAGADFAFGIAIAYLSFVFIGSIVMRLPGVTAVGGLYPFKFIYNIVIILLSPHLPYTHIYKNK